MKFVLVLVHRIHFGNQSKAGGIDQILSYLEASGKTFILVEHPLGGKGKSKVIVNQDHREYDIPFAGPIRWFIEYFFNLIYLFINNKKIEFIISVDSLNFLSAISYAVVSKKRFLLLLPDYSDYRFNNRFLNFIYKLTTRISCTLSEQTICVSKSMKDLAQSWGINGNKITIIPNSPALSSIIPRNGSISNPPKIVFTKSEISLEESLFLLGIIKKLNEYGCPFSLTVIGKMSQESISLFPVGINLTGLISLKENHVFLKESDIGLAIYLKPKSFEKYADSLKIREYAALGLPIISTPHVSTALEGRDANCILIASTEGDFVQSIIRLTRNNSEYGEMAQNSRSWALENDKDKILSDFFSHKFKIQ